jgi:hypothetical protein
MDYPNAKFLIYNCWERDVPYKVAGSLLLDCAITEDEAKEKLEIYKVRHDDFETKFPSSNSSNTRTRFIYIVNQPEWWTNYKIKVSSL